MRTLSIIFITTVLFCSCSTNAKIEDPPVEEPQIEEPKIVGQSAITETELRQFAVNMRNFLDQGNDFAFRLFKQTDKELSEDNLFLSPYSLSCALAMLYNGAEGETQEEIAKVLGLGDYTAQQVNDYYRTLTKALLEGYLPGITSKSSSAPLTDIGITNAVWSHTATPAKQSFVDLVKTYFDAEVRTMDFSLPSSLQAINDWCKEKTKGTIPHILDELDPPMVLGNAVYFNSPWTVPFEPSETVEKPFYNRDGSTSTVQMMHQKELCLQYTRSANYEVVRFPYADEAFAMNILLPAEGVDIDDIISRSGDYLRPPVDIAYVTLSMPRFTLKGEEMRLNGVLRAMGMPRAFTPAAELSAMLDVNAFVGKVLQKSYIDVSEEGTEASAVSLIVAKVILDDAPPPPPHVTIEINRPFLFTITERVTDVTLFMGKITKL